MGFLLDFFLPRSAAGFGSMLSVVDMKGNDRERRTSVNGPRWDREDRRQLGTKRKMAGGRKGQVRGPATGSKGK